MNKLLAALLIASAAIAAKAETPSTFNVLNIERADGAVEQLKLDTALDISLTPEGNFRLTHPQITVEYPAGMVRTFSFDNAETPGVYTGDYESGLPTVDAETPALTIAPGRISAAGPDDIIIYDLKGVETARAKSVDNKAELLTARLPKGIYIAVCGSTTLKITL